MTKLFCLMAVCAVLGGGLTCADVRADALKEEQTRLTKDLQTRLQQLSRFVESSSRAQSRLMTERSVSANPTGYAMRHMSWGDAPIIRICPVSRPYDVTLGKPGTGTAMAAVTVMEQGENLNPGVYLLVKVKPRKSQPSSTGGAMLVAVSLGKGGVLSFTKRADLPRVHKPFSTAGELPIATADFSGMDVNLRLRWDEETFHFTFRPALEYV